MKLRLKTPLHLCLAVLLLAGCQQESEKEQTPLIPRKLLFGNPEKARPKLSPDGSTIAFLAPNENNVLNVFIHPSDSPHDVRQVTNDEKRGIRHFFWQYDNDHILYIQDKDGDEDWHLYQTNLDTAETRDLTPYDGVRVDVLDYSHKYPEEMLIQMNKDDPALFDVYRLNLGTGEMSLDTKNPDNVNYYVTDNDLNVRVAQSYTDDGQTLIRIRDAAPGSKWRELMRWKPEQGEGSPVGFSPDNTSLYFLTNLKNNTTQFMEIDLQTQKGRVIAQDDAFDVSNVLVHPKTFKPQAVAVQKDKLEWILLDPSLRKDFEIIKKLGPVFTISSVDLEDENWIVASVSDTRPTHYYFYNRASKEPKFLFSTLPALEEYQMNSMKPVRFNARDGLELHGYLTLPQGKEPKNLPMILYVHGGPWVRESWGFDPMAQWLSNRGYGVLQVNFRGSTGFGKEFLHAGNKEWGGKMQTDLIDAKEWLVEQGYADPDKVLIYGGSYGGYAVLAGLAFTPDAFCCGIDIVGPSSLLTLLETIPPYWKPARAVFDNRVGNYDTEKEFLRERSPLFQADRIKKPLLIAQGANDPRVKKSESDQIVEAVRRKGKDVQYLLFEDEGHGFARPENRLRFYAAAEEFMKRHLGGRAEAPAPDEEWKSLER